MFEPQREEGAQNFPRSSSRNSIQKFEFEEMSRGQFSGETESSSTSESTCSSRIADVRKSELSKNSVATPVSIFDIMNETYFQQWKRMVRGRMEQEQCNVPDSISPFVSQVPDTPFVDTQSQHMLSSEEFQLLLQDPPSNWNSSSNPNSGVPSLHNGFYSCPPPHSTSSMGAGTASEEVHRNQSTKRLAKKTPAKKLAKKTKVVISDDEGEGEDSGDRRWSDGEVQQLISFRSEMDEEFLSHAKKQGVHMWDRLQEKMLAACDGFTKSAEACRKKWKVVYRQYCTDKRLLNVSGEGRKVGCKFFDEIDQGFNNRATVRKLCHGDARGSPNPCPLDLNQPGDENRPGDSMNVDLSDQESPPQQSTPQSVKSVKSSKMSSSDMYSMYMGDMVTKTSEIAKDIRETNSVLKELTNSIGRLIDKF